MASPESGNDTGARALTYLDNDAATFMPPEVVDTVTRWMNRGNPSAEYASAREARKMMQRVRQPLAVDGGFELEGPRPSFLNPETR